MQLPCQQEEVQSQSQALEQRLEAMGRDCTGCGVCQKDCAFLSKHGTPDVIAQKLLDSDPAQRVIAYECSLCGLCEAACPRNLQPQTVFLAMRESAVKGDQACLSDYRGLIGYENTGVSKRFSWYGLPKGCDTVFFPGCALPGTRPQHVQRLFSLLQKKIPTLGIVLDCCTKPSHDLGDRERFETFFSEMTEYLVGQGVRTILTACPNCFQVFKRYGDNLAVCSVYGEILREALPVQKRISTLLTVHDPCVTRFEDEIHRDVRLLVSTRTSALVEMPHTKRRTVCCGEGGSVGCLEPAHVDHWQHVRMREAGRIPMVSYCAGCVASLGRKTPTFHLLDLLFNAPAVEQGTVPSPSPLKRYWNRLQLKRQLKKEMPACVTRERPPLVRNASRGKLAFRLGMLSFLLMAIIMVRTTDLSQFLNPEALRSSIDGLGLLAPLLYMLAYCLAPVLFLPGLPLSLVGGVLFGPFWGVIYTIFGATAGATLAFLTARYLGRDWIASKLKGPRWQKLDRDVEEKGWKVVLFTRLVPLFPFNLLNYAFGLTPVKLSHYIAATFWGMLPGCIAYIVFSSSLLDVLRGNVSPEFMWGVGLMVAVSLLPLAIRRLSARRSACGE